jgi:hypothetical protein
MKLNFTKIVFALFSVLSVGILSAQNINQMVVTNNGNSTQYDFVLGAFGDNTLAVNAEATLVDDGVDPGSDACEPITMDFMDDIAVIDRGTCSFIDKVRNAQAAGAVAVVICNSQLDPTTGDDISDAAIIPGVAAGTVTDDVTALVVGISFNDCQTLKLDLESGTTTIAFTFECAMPDYGPEVVWGANGEGAFNGGLNGWSVDKGDGSSLEDGGWFYDIDAILDRGAFGTNAGFAQTPTACNGVMLFDSDFYDTAGEADGAAGTGFNDGVCISDAGAGLFCEGLLISPDIDLAALNSTQGFEVSWTQSVRQFQSEYFLLLSRDGGATFADTIAINSDIAVNTRVDDTRSVPLCGYNDVSQFRFAFLYRGAFYFWAIDDVIINEVPTTVDLSANPFFANYPNLVTPASQVDEAAFIIDVENLEAGTATNTSVDVEIFNLTTGTSVYTDSQNYPDIGCGVLDENRVFPDRFTGELDEGSYEIRYTVNTDDDVNTANNTQSVGFEIGGDTFRKIDRDAVIAAGNDAYIAVPDEAFYSIGQYYKIPNGSGFKATSCRFGFEPENDDNGNPLEFNAIINFQLFRWLDDGDFQCQPGERVLVGSSRRIVSSSQPEDFTNLFVELTNPNDVDAEIELADDGDYIMMASFSPLSSTAAPLRTLATPQADLPHYYGGTNLAFTQQFNEYRGGGFMLAVGIDGDEEDRTYGTGNNFTVYMPLTIKPLGATDTEDLLDDQSISVFPNPVSEMLYVDMNLDAATDINLELVDVQGRVIATQNYNSTSGVLEMNVATVPAGIYSLNVRTEDGLTSKKVIIQ